MILRAQIVLPVAAAPLRDGAVTIIGSRIRAVTPWRELGRAQQRRAIDLGKVLLMPGLVNAHCHLDYTHMAGQIPPPKLFTDFLKMMVSTKAGWTLKDYMASWQEGAGMLLRSGTTTVADIEAVPELLPQMWRKTPLRIISFLEMITISKPAEVVLGQALKMARTLPGGRGRTGLSPHAPYTTVPELLRLTAGISRKHGLLLSTHIAESETEFKMFSAGGGEMYDWLRRSGRDMSDCGSASPVRHFWKAGMLNNNLLAAHVNYLARGDIGLLRNAGVSVVHCPRSHFYFRHAKFPVGRLLRAGVNVCLGSDSLVTVYKKPKENVELNMFAEMRTLQARETALSARKILAMATLNGARALHLEGKVGQLSPGAYADLIALPLKGEMPDPYAGVLKYEGPIEASMIGGRWAISPAL